MRLSVVSDRLITGKHIVDISFNPGPDANDMGVCQGWHYLSQPMHGAECFRRRHRCAVEHRIRWPAGIARDHHITPRDLAEDHQPVDRLYGRYNEEGQGFCNELWWSGGKHGRCLTEHGGNVIGPGTRCIDQMFARRWSCRGPL